MKNIINSKNVFFHYPDEEDETKNKSEQIFKDDVLKDINLEIQEGSFVAILGHNGCGKSTFAKHLNAILIPSDGKVTVNGYDTSDEENILDVRKTVGMVFQNPDNQIVEAIVEDDVAFGPENLGIEPLEIRLRVDEALKAVDMYEYRKHSPSRLSGGQKQRVAIAGIIAMRPKCIVLDEPTAMLDPSGRKEVMQTLEFLRQEYHITIVLITHYMDEAAQCDRVILMNKGRVVRDDVPVKVFSDVEYMKELGLDVPQVTELAYELKKSGVDIDTDIIEEDKIVDILTNLLK
jgi:energy-coupling factor transport system ATP-binding protein